MTRASARDGDIDFYTRGTSAENEKLCEGAGKLSPMVELINRDAPGLDLDVSDVGICNGATNIANLFRRC